MSLVTDDTIFFLHVWHKLLKKESLIFPTVYIKVAIAHFVGVWTTGIRHDDNHLAHFLIAHLQVCH